MAGHDIYYTLIGDEGVAFEDICLVKQKPSWWKKLPTFIDNISPESFIKDNWNKVVGNPANKIEITATRRNIKGCPAVNTFLSNSMLVTFPSDLLLETVDTGEYGWRSFVDGFEVANHTTDQVEASHIQKDYIIIKFQLPVVFQSDNNRWLFQDCLLEKVQPYRCFNGLGSLSSVNRLNVICAFPKINKKYFFKRGEPLCSVLFLDRFKSITQKDLTKQWSRKRYKMTSTLMDTTSSRVNK